MREKQRNISMMQRRQYSSITKRNLPLQTYLENKHPDLISKIKNEVNPELYNEITHKIILTPLILISSIFNS